MFSITPSTGMFSCRNIPTALRTSETATPWGVVTTTAPAIGTLWAMLRATSPVPGGRSTTR